MKKIVIIFAIACLSTISANAQFLYSLGVGVGASYGKELWSSEQLDTKEKYLLGFNGAVFAEFFRNPNFQWRSELMYNQLGTKEVVDGLVNSSQYINKTHYISFDNYLKCNYPLYNWIPYFLIGPRIEYLAGRSETIFPDVIAGMPSVHVSAAAGIGISKICYSHIKPFLEFFYNRDITPAFSGPVAPTGKSKVINNQDFEIRIGLKYVFKEKDKCPKVYNPAGNPPGAQ